MKKVSYFRHREPELANAYLVNEVVAVYKNKPIPHRNLPVVQGSRETAQILQAHYDNLLFNNIEYFSILCFNRANKPVYWQIISQGGITGTVADPRIILLMTILVGATSIVLCHNHPSGSLKPSVADRELTLKIKEAAKTIDITVLDHIILSNEEYFSFVDEGIL